MAQLDMTDEHSFASQPGNVLVGGDREHRRRGSGPWQPALRAKMGTCHEFFLEPKNTALVDQITKNKASYRNFNATKFMLERPPNLLLAETESAGFLFPNAPATDEEEPMALVNAQTRRHQTALETQAIVAIESQDLWALQARRNALKAQLREHELTMSLNPNEREHALREVKSFPIIPWGPKRITKGERISNTFPIVPKIKSVAKKKK